MDLYRRASQDVCYNREDPVLTMEGRCAVQAAEAAIIAAVQRRLGGGVAEPPMLHSLRGRTAVAAMSPPPPPRSQLEKRLPVHPTGKPTRHEHHKEQQQQQLDQPTSRTRASTAPAEAGALLTTSFGAGGEAAQGPGSSEYPGGVSAGEETEAAAPAGGVQRDQAQPSGDAEVSGASKPRSQGALTAATPAAPPGSSACADDSEGARSHCMTPAVADRSGDSGMASTSSATAAAAAEACGPCGDHDGGGGPAGSAKERGQVQRQEAGQEQGCEGQEPELGLLLGLSLSCGPELHTVDMAGIMTTATGVGPAPNWSALSASSTGDMSLERMWTGEASAAAHVISALPPQQRTKRRPQPPHLPQHNPQQAQEEEDPHLGSFTGPGGRSAGRGPVAGLGFRARTGSVCGTTVGSTACSRAAVGRYGTLMISSAGWRCTELYDMHDSLLLSRLSTFRFVPGAGGAAGMTGGGVGGGVCGMSGGGGAGGAGTDGAPPVGFSMPSLRLGQAASLAATSERRDSELQVVGEAAAELSAMETAALFAAASGEGPCSSRSRAAGGPQSIAAAATASSVDPAGPAGVSTAAPGGEWSGPRMAHSHGSRTAGRVHRGPRVQLPPPLSAPALQLSSPPPLSQHYHLSQPMPYVLLLQAQQQAQQQQHPVQHRLAAAAANSGGGRAANGASWSAALEALLEKVNPRPGYYAPPPTAAAGSALHRTSTAGGLVERSGGGAVVASMRRWAGQVRARVSGIGEVGAPAPTPGSATPAERTFRRSFVNRRTSAPGIAGGGGRDTALSQVSANVEGTVALPSPTWAAREQSQGPSTAPPLPETLVILAPVSSSTRRSFPWRPSRTSAPGGSGGGGGGADTAGRFRDVWSDRQRRRLPAGPSAAAAEAAGDAAGDIVATATTASECSVAWRAPGACSPRTSPSGGQGAALHRWPLRAARSFGKSGAVECIGGGGDSGRGGGGVGTMSPPVSTLSGGEGEEEDGGGGGSGAKCFTTCRGPSSPLRGVSARSRARSDGGGAWDGGEEAAAGVLCSSSVEDGGALGDGGRPGEVHGLGLCGLLRLLCRRQKKKPVPRDERGIRRCCSAGHGEGGGVAAAASGQPHAGAQLSGRSRRSPVSVSGRFRGVLGGAAATPAAPDPVDSVRRERLARIAPLAAAVFSPA